MVVTECGKNWEGEPCKFYIEGTLLENLRPVKKVVIEKDFDHVNIIAGLPGMGKSNFAISLAKFYDNDFSIKNICFTADEFVHLTNTLPKRSAIILDESFDSMNSRVGTSKDFLKIMNHLQLIRQRNLFIILNLPNYFDLHKSIAIYRSSFLFVVYGKEFGDRGRFAAFGRDEKKRLYIDGKKYMNYHCVQPNFRGKFFKQTAIDFEAYEEMKLKHLREQASEGVTESSIRQQRDTLLAYNRFLLNIPVNDLMELTGMEQRTLYTAANRQKENVLKNFGEIKNDG